ncbi:type VII secretion protein EccB [Corynebacterium sp. TAE3-ERU12]|uniref:type VII secretion protein EccB n=1 Tax=Corynebacterium sp. TAE3-ERU12 TaxID=2849491 RepID=UPI001C46F9B9|nr:type VII secretion protein EccB [Corynebacterium sp. TAE3-ERU12]MBV7294686.1 type VII secretion protein EccB [Corynebacterium sp. TAE3-ERU12]
MPRTPTTPAQVSGHRFLVRQVEHALMRADARMLHDPLRTRVRALATGAVLAVLVVAGAAVLGLVRPAATAAADKDIVLVRDSGAVYVRLDGTMHPAANLASARLALGRAVVPARVGQEALRGAPMGPRIGIAGAPDVAAEQPTPTPPAAGVCEEVAADANSAHSAHRVQRSIVRLGSLPPQRLDIGDSAAVLGFDGDWHWLITAGTRARIDPADPVLARALQLGQAPVRPIGADLLRAIPERAAVAVPGIPDLGKPTGLPAPYDRIGRVVHVGDRDVVALPEGAVDVPPVVARALAAVAGSAEAPETSLSTIPVAKPLGIGSLPAKTPQWVAGEGWLCADTGATTVRLSTTAPRESAIVATPSADGARPGLDGYIGPRSTIAARTNDGVHLISATGIRHRVHTSRSAAALGYPEATTLPWSVLVALREGPELTRAAALATD